VFVGCIALIRPWGDFPINDDWQYAKIALQFAKTGIYKTHYQIAPALVGQVLLSYPIIKLFGFSHLALRILTLVLSCCMIIGLNAWLKLARVSTSLRLIVLLAWILNPLFLYSSATFMNEIYGYLPVLMAALLWFRSRSRSDEIEISTVLLTAFLAGIAFWTRQFAAVVWPSLAATYLIRFWSDPRLRPKFKREFAKLLAGATLFFSIVIAYFVWAKSSGNYNEAFASPMAKLFQFSFDAWATQLAAAPMYLTLFLACLLPFFRFKLLHKKTFLISLSAMSLVVGISLYVIYSIAEQDMYLVTPINQTFPILVNIINRFGIGPLTLADIYIWGIGEAEKGEYFWLFLHWLLAFAAPIVTAATFTIIATRKKETWDLTGEMSFFGLLFALTVWILTTQVYQINVFDRYYFPIVLGLLLASPILGNFGKFFQPSKSRILMSLILLLPLGAYSVAGVHDHFRWQEERWNLFNELIKAGTRPTEISAGYEVNGWNGDNFNNTPQIIDGCRAPGWGCGKHKYIIYTQTVWGCTSLKSVKINSWLGLTPNLELERCDTD
jgi:hypothetical protein